MLLTTTVPILSTSKSFEQNNTTKRNHFINGQRYILEIKILLLFISFISLFPSYQKNINVIFQAHDQ